MMCCASLLAINGKVLWREIADGQDRIKYRPLQVKPIKDAREASVETPSRRIDPTAWVYALGHFVERNEPPCVKGLK